MLIDRVKDCEVGLLWDIFTVYIDKNLKELNELLLTELVDELYKRVEVELHKLLNKETDNSLLLIRSLNVVKCITFVKNYLVGKPFLEGRIWSFHEFLKYVKRITFEDDIIEIINGVLIQKHTFKEREMQLLPYIKAVFDKDGGVM